MIAEHIMSNFSSNKNDSQKEATKLEVSDVDDYVTNKKHKELYNVKKKQNEEKRDGKQSPNPVRRVGPKI